MNKFTTHTGIAAPLYQANIDTDQIIPKQFLKRIERSGYGEFLFYDWRFGADGLPNPEFVLNDPRFADASILLAGPNFGCGSSREHAPWSLMDHGFRVIIAPGFADIFYSNSIQNGLLPVVLDEADVTELVRKSRATEGYALSVDLENCEIRDGTGFKRNFNIDDFDRSCLLNGWDQIALTLLHEDRIAAFEA
jgi:3-isopropylmalate/(R)-2-methylmalate dehydratase small subunit